MTTRYVEPLGAAYRRMSAALFHPFNIDTWIAVGFASWISSWSWGGSYNYRFSGPSPGSGPPAVEDAFRPFREWMSGLWEDPVGRIGLIAGVLALLALVVLLMWISSRGEFVFLDAVLHGRKLIAEPWRAGRAQGNSLFVWRLGFSLIMLAGFAMMSGAVFLLASGGRMPRTIGDVRWLPLLVGLASVWLPFMLAGIYIDVFLRHFVTPIMFRDRVTTAEAWRTFLPVLRERLGSFLLYGLFLLVVQIGLVLALIPAILLTCCLLGCLLILPFIGAVVWLPVTYTFRAFGPEFLAQFGPAYDVWPRPAIAPETPPEVPS